MLWHTIVLSSVLALPALAWDESYPVYCDETQPGPCLQRLSDACYACIHPIEAACPGTDKDFTDCFCAIPSSSWTAIEKCFNDPNTGCNDGSITPTSETFALFNTFAVECAGYDSICGNGGKLDSVQQILSTIANCSVTTGTTTSAPPTSSATGSTTSATTTTVKSSSNLMTSSATSHSQVSSASGSATHGTTTTTSAAGVPTSNVASNNVIGSGFYALALALGGAAIHAL